MASCSSHRRSLGLPDYTQNKARVRRHDTYVKTTALGSSQSSLDYDEDTTSTHSAMTIQEFRESLSRNEDEEEEITFMLRLPKKKWRDGSAHSASKGRYNVSQDEGRQYTMNEERTPPARAISGKSKIMVRTPSSDFFLPKTRNTSTKNHFE